MGPFSSSLWQRIDPQRATLVQHHQQSVKRIAASEIKYVHAAAVRCDDFAKQQLREAKDRAHQDFKAVLSNHWLNAVFSESDGRPATAAASPSESVWEDELTAAS
jgi:hypothetical protein